MAKAKIEIDPHIVTLKNSMDVLVEEVKAVNYEIEELAAMQQEQELNLKAKFEAKKEKLEKKKELILMEIRALVDQVPHKETKTQRKVSLPGGDVVVKKPTTKITADKNKLLAWAKENNLTDLIDIKEVASFKWAEFKGQLELTNSGIVDTHTGELMEIDGLSVEDVAEEVQIKY